MAYEMDVKFTEESSSFKASFDGGERFSSFTADFGSVEFLPVKIMPATKTELGGIKVGDGLVITSDGTLSTDKPILWNTKEEWNSHPDIIATAGVMYVYSDYKVIDGVTYSNFKIGDGTSFLIDLPFGSIDMTFAEVIEKLAEVVEEHVADSEIHVSAEDRMFWDNKVTAYISESNPEILVLSKL